MLNSICILVPEPLSDVYRQSSDGKCMEDIWGSERGGVRRVGVPIAKGILQIISNPLRLLQLTKNRACFPSAV